MPRKQYTEDEHYNDPFPSNLRELMDKRGVRQEDLTPVLGVSNRQSVTGYKDGRTAPTADKIVAIAKYFDVSADWLLGLTEKDVRTADFDLRQICEYTGLSDVVVKLLHYMSELEPDNEERRPLSLIDHVLKKCFTLDEIVDNNLYPDTDGYLGLCLFAMIDRYINAEGEIDVRYAGGDRLRIMVRGRLVDDDFRVSELYRQALKDRVIHRIESLAWQHDLGMKKQEAEK